MKNKIVNIIHNISLGIFILSYMFLSFFSYIKTAEAQGGFNIGGRITMVMTENAVVPFITACLAPCASNQCVTMTPYGGTSMPIICMPTGMQTTSIPVTPAASGAQILGLFSTLSPIAMPLGIVGTSL